MNGNRSPSSGRTLVREIIDRIREHIVEKGLSPGDRLPTEREICLMFDVGRSTVREALTVLEVLGAVARRPKLGTVLAEVDFGAIASIIRFLVVRSEKDLGDLLEARRMFEVNSLHLVHENWSDESHRSLRQAAADYAKAVREGRDGLHEDARFHETLVERANNPFIRYYASMIREFFDAPPVAVPLTEEQKKLTIDEHHQVVELLAAGRVAHAQQLLHRHLSRYLERGIVAGRPKS